MFVLLNMTMQITNITLYNKSNNNYKKFNTKEIKKTPTTKSFEPKTFSGNIPFTAMFNVKPRKINIINEQNKLLKQILDTLAKDIDELDVENYLLNRMNQILNQYRQQITRLQELNKELDSIKQDYNFSNPILKLAKLNKLEKEFKQLTKCKITPPKPAKITPDEKTDFELVNKFKSSITKGDYRLSRVYNEHYQSLNKIKTLKELTAKFPKIKIPPTPEEVISNKIVKVLTRDIYEQLDSLITEGDVDKVIKYLSPLVKNFTDAIAEKHHFNKDQLYTKLAVKIHSTILRNYENLKGTLGFASIPTTRKNKLPDVTHIDAAMLRVNFDDFVLNVIRQQYIDGKKLSEIVYNQNNTNIIAQSLSSTEYKFDKPSEKIKQMVIIAENINRAQKDYQLFNPEQLKSRLDFFASTDIGNNEEILEHIINFDSCKFTQEDIEQLIKFLTKLDDIRDDKITINQGIEIIKKENINPKGTEKLNAIERQKALEKIKQEQQNLYKLNKLRDNFDNLINILYMNNLNGIATTCAKYSPKSLDHEDVKNANELIKIISNHINEESITNKKLLETTITRWDTFNYYKKNHPENQLFQKAIKYAQKPNGDIDINKAGQYLINSEIISHYPESRSFCRHPQILDKIIERTQTPEQGIKYLSKYDNYFDLLDEDKSKINVILTMFNPKDSVEKILLKYIIENNYSNIDTKVLTRVNDKGNETIETTISSSAKKQILEKYKYPGCIEYMREFEEALSSFASARGASGIKKTGTNNNALEYKMELKLKAHDDRLFSSQNNYIFDIYSSKGLH